MLRLKIILQSKYLLFSICIITIILSFIRCNIRVKSKYNINETSFSGIVESVKEKDNEIIFTFKGKEKIKATYYYDEYINLKAGNYISVEGTLSIPNNNTVPNTFNYKKYLYYNHINYVLSVEKLEVINNRKSIKQKLEDYILTFKSKEYLSMFILGDKKYLDEDIYNNYKSLGITHIFAISGMHVSLLSCIILKLLSKLKDYIKYLITITFLLLYVVLLGYQPSVVKTAILFIILYLNKSLKLELSTLQCFYITLSIMLLIEPFYLYNVGFQYSVLVTYSLIRYEKLINSNYLISLIKISLLSFLISLPITINNNYEINILSFLNNLIYVPLISMVIYPFSLLTFIVKPLDYFLYPLTKFLEFLSDKLFVLNIIIPKLSIVQIVIYYIVLYIFLNTYNKKILLVLISLLLIYKYQFSNDLKVYYLDVGQGDSIVIKYKRKTILIDTGGVNSYYNKESYITENAIKFLKSISSSKIDYLIITHGDNDHMGESINIVNNFKVDKVILNCGEYNDLENELIDTLNNKNVKYYSCIKELNLYKYKLNFLYTNIYDNENDNSNVIYLNYKNYKFLFMGDASTTKEEDILKEYNLTNIDFLKVGHHGSDTSSGELFINSINPKYSIISVGKNNRYGHPKDSVLNTLKNTKIYRTDIDGSIEIKINKKGYKIRTYSP